jgi:acetoin utilization deacetylase AcuC-like enzyme
MQEVKNRLGVIFFPAFDWAISPTHPERQERLLYTMDQLKEEGVFDIPGIREYKPDVAELEDVERVHFCFPDVQSNVTDSHLISAGGTIKAARLLMEGREDKIFALVRPPGHHSMKVVHGGRGFCNINIEAIMVEYLRDKYGVKKVAIVDTDCHHGDGTQDIYWHDPDTLYISIHQDGRTLYPGSGFTSELGGPKARGKTINIPLPPYTSDEGFLYAMENVVMPILEDFKA